MVMNTCKTKYHQCQGTHHFYFPNKYIKWDKFRGIFKSTESNSGRRGKFSCQKDADGKSWKAATARGGGKRSDESIRTGISTTNWNYKSETKWNDGQNVAHGKRASGMIRMSLYAIFYFFCKLKNLIFIGEKLDFCLIGTIDEKAPIRKHLQYISGTITF